MKKILIVLGIFLTFLNAEIFQSVPLKDVHLENKNEGKEYCSMCAMSLATYYKTNFIYKGKQYCSFHCLLEDTKGSLEENLKVVDTKKLKFIDAKNAFYVIGSKKSGTMTMNSKYAFEDETDAKEFQKENGGEIYNFLDALKIAKNDLKKELAMIKTKREKKVYKVGKKLYEKKCSKVDVNSYHAINELKEDLKNKCEIKKDKRLQVVSIYLWDTKKLNKSERKIKRLEVPHDAKCPICGMFVAKFPKWATKIEIGQNAYYFDGPKDMFKFIFQKGKNKIDKIFVSDYFTTKMIDGKKAYYVIGSDVYGPMGKELIAFESDTDAYSFKNDHFGKKVFTYSEMTDEVLIYLQ